MKKFITALYMMAFASGLVIAQQISVTGEVKTGFYWEKTQREGQASKEIVKMHNNDDAGSDLGRIRLNVDVKKDDIGFMFRINQEIMSESAPRWPYAFAYANFFEDQFKVSIGKLGGGSPWATGGPEMWEELETAVGARFEYKPNYVPGLNVGFALNNMNNTPSQVDVKPTMGDYLAETVFGVRYDHDLFALRFAFRLDSTLDTRDTNDEGASLIYRAEEKVLTKYLPGFQIWANGHYTGIAAADPSLISFLNWLYIQYDRKSAGKWDNFTAQLRVGYDIVETRSILHLRPSFYYNLFNKLLSLGTSFQFAQDFGEGKMWADSPYLYWNIEPKIQVNLGHFMAAFAFHFEDRYKYNTAPPREQLTWWNLRVGFTF